MAQKQVFARARPAWVRCKETYCYYADVSSNPSLRPKSEPEGHIDICIPYDGHTYFGRDAWKDVEHQLGSSPAPASLDALIGHLGFQNYQRTNLDSVLQLTAHNDVIPLAIPVLGEGLTDLDQLHTDRHECRVSHTYKPEPPEVHPIRVEAFIFDEESLEERGARPDVESKHQDLVVQELYKQAGFSRTLMLRLDVQLHLPDAVSKGGLSPQLKHVRVEWPRSTSHRALTLVIGQDPDGPVNERLVYNPEWGELEWGDLLMWEADKSPGTGLRLYVAPPMWLKIGQPGELYRRETLRGSLTVELPGLLLSGVKPLYFDTLGNQALDNLVELSTTVGLDMAIYLEDRFGVRTLSPYRHLQFEGVILDDMRVQDIVTLLEDRGFEVFKPVELPTDRQGAYRSLITGKKREGAEQMLLWLLADGVMARTKRETKIPGGKTFTTEVDTGSTKIYMRGQLQGDSHRLTTVMNDIQMSLKERLRHVSTLE